jgi:hypothetical protein
MDIIITKEKVEFNTSQLGSSKDVVMVQFPNCISTKTGKPFKWLPTYKQLEEIRKSLEEIEKESWNENKR